MGNYGSKLFSKYKPSPSQHVKESFEPNPASSSFHFSTYAAMKRKKLIYSTFKVGFNAGEDSDEYEYDDDVKTNKPSRGGTRLVGARTAKKVEAPFVVAINTNG